MNSYFYSNTIQDFLTSSTNEIFGTIARNSDFPDEPTQKGHGTKKSGCLKKYLQIIKAASSLNIPFQEWEEELMWCSLSKM